MMIRFYLLDVSYEVRGREPVILLWGLNEKSEPILLIDKSFRPYFYILPEKDVGAEELIPLIKALSKPSSPILEVKVVDRKYYGRPVKALKVTTSIPEYVRTYREEAKKVKGVSEVLEADIRFSMRYLIDKDISPSTWLEVEAVESEGSQRFRVRKIYEVKGEFKNAGIDLPPPLKVMAFDIEAYNPRGSPIPEKDPVIIVSLADNSGDLEILTAGEGPKGDLDLIPQFTERVRAKDPDIIVGYNSNGFDWPYLVKRAELLGIKLDVGRSADGLPRTSVYGHISIPGRLNVDLYDFAKEIYEVKVKSLEEVAEYLGVMKKSERVLIPWFEIYKYWDDKAKRETLLKYARDDVISTLGLADKFIPFAIQLSSLTGLPLDQVGAASVGFRLEWFLIRAARKFKELVPNRVERPYSTYKGAIVLQPVKGIHENIAVLDFSSMYPSLMIKYNIGPDTFVDGECSEEECYVIPGLNYRFRKEPPGFYKNVLTTLLSLRKKVKEELRKYKPDSPQYRLLNERQKALKVLANASYGYMGWTGARWYFKEGAEAVTALGRETIQKAIEIAKELGLRVIYGDTDSLFVSNDRDKIEQFIEKVRDELGLEIKVDKVYTRVFFTEAKKRYVGLTLDGRIDIVGFEAVRGDWTDIAKDVQEKVAQALLTSGKPEDAIEYVRRVIKDLRMGRIPLEKLVIWKKLTKKLEEYDVSAPHVEAAKKLVELGVKVVPGTEVGYVITKGSGSISSRAVPFIIAKPEDIDTEYYVKHQILPAALRILSYFGITEKQLEAAGKAQKTLVDFLTSKKQKSK